MGMQHHRANLYDRHDGTLRLSAVFACLWIEHELLHRGLRHHLRYIRLSMAGRRAEEL